MQRSSTFSVGKKVADPKTAKWRPVVEPIYIYANEVNHFISKIERNVDVECFGI